MLISYSYPKLRAIRHTINIEGAGKNISVQSRKVKRGAIRVTKGLIVHHLG